MASILWLILRVLSTLTPLCWGGVPWCNPGWPLGGLTKHSACGNILTASWTPLSSLYCKNLGEKIVYGYQTQSIPWSHSHVPVHYVTGEEEPGNETNFSTIKVCYSFTGQVLSTARSDFLDHVLRTSPRSSMLVTCCHFL